MKLVDLPKIYVGDFTLWIKDPNGFCRSLGTGNQLADPVGMLRHAEIDLE